jgi:hypothetical protein
MRKEERAGRRKLHREELHRLIPPFVRLLRRMMWFETEVAGLPVSPILFETEVAGLPVSPIFKDQAVREPSKWKN